MSTDDFIKNYSKGSEIGYTLVVDAGYSKLHKDIPFYTFSDEENV